MVTVMFTKLRIQNFKAWKDTKDIRLAPLTVFFGTNSAGKTSISQLLLMLKQTRESPDRRQILHSGDQSSLVDLGSFRDMVFQHDVRNQISFLLQWGLPDPLIVKEAYYEETYEGEQLAFRAAIGVTSKRDEKLCVHEMFYTLGEPTANGLRIGMLPAKSGNFREYKFESDNFEPVRKQGRGWALPPPIRFYGFPNQATAYFQNSGFVADLAFELEQQFDKLYYLGPLRRYPSRDYSWSGEIPEHVGWRGDHAVEALLAASDRFISPGFRKKSRPFHEVIASWLTNLELVSSFETRVIARHKKRYEVMVRAGGRSEEVNLTDVGFGVSQVLPVVVQCFYAPYDSTVILEQPEIHLHPSVQANLADLFIETIRAREDGCDRNIQLIVESHSEHFLRRLQRRIAEEKLRPEEVALYFCEPSDAGARIKVLELDEYGNIRNWPAGFFGDELGDLVAMTEAAAAREASDTK